MVCSRGQGGVRLLWSMKIFHLIAPVRTAAVRPRNVIDRLTWLWLLMCFDHWGIVTFLLKDKVYCTFRARSAGFSLSALYTFSSFYMYADMCMPFSNCCHEYTTRQDTRGHLSSCISYYSFNIIRFFFKLWENVKMCDLIWYYNVWGWRVH